MLNYAKLKLTSQPSMHHSADAWDEGRASSSASRGEPRASESNVKTCILPGTIVEATPLCP